MEEKEPREHGLIFGRGDELPAGTEEPPLASPPLGVSIYGPPVQIAFGDPPPEKVELVGDVPWELRDDSDSDAAKPNRN